MKSLKSGGVYTQGTFQPWPAAFQSPMLPVLLCWAGTRSLREPLRGKARVHFSGVHWVPPQTLPGCRVHTLHITFLTPPNSEFRNVPGPGAAVKRLRVCKNTKNTTTRMCLRCPCGQALGQGFSTF